MWGEWVLLEHIKDSDVELQSLQEGVLLANMLVLELTIIQKVKDNQLNDPEFDRIIDPIAKKPDFRIVDGAL